MERSNFAMRVACILKSEDLLFSCMLILIMPINYILITQFEYQKPKPGSFEAARA